MAVAELPLPRLSKPLKIWERIEIVIGEGSEAGIYTARVEDFVNSGILVDAPEYVRGNTLLRSNAAVSILITREDAVYQCQSVVKKLIRANGEAYILTPPSNVKRVQRRQFARIEVTDKLSWALIKPVMDYESFEESLTWHDSTTVDLSGGGALIHINDEPRVDDRLLLKFAFFPGIELPETVVAVCRREALDERQRMVGVEFITSDNLRKFFESHELEQLPTSVRHFGRVAQNRLVSFIFHKQVELRQKGLL